MNYIRVNFAFILSGCGVHGGSENNELTLALLSVSQLGGKFAIFAPDSECDLLNPFNGTNLSQKGNILYESAKISSGLVQDLDNLKIEEFDGLILPGGYGIIKSLSNINDFLSGEITDSTPKINEIVKKTILHFHQEKKPIIGICIAPILIASVIQNCKMTLGKIESKPENYPIELNYIPCTSENFVFDKDNLFYSTPAFMASTDLAIVYNGIYNTCESAINNLRKK